MEEMNAATVLLTLVTVAAGTQLNSNNTNHCYKSRLQMH